jgi:hypothetical protein
MCCMCQATGTRSRHVYDVRGHVPPVAGPAAVGARRACGGRAVAQRAQPRRRRVGVVGHGLGRNGAAVPVASARGGGAACDERRVLQHHQQAVRHVARGRGAYRCLSHQYNSQVHTTFCSPDAVFVLVFIFFLDFLPPACSGGCGDVCAALS